MSRDEKQICQYCDAWQPHVQYVDGRQHEFRYGECRRRAPVSFPDAPKFPSMRGGDWCAEFIERRDDHNSDIRPFQHISELVEPITKEIKTSLPEGQSDEPEFP